MPIDSLLTTIFFLETKSLPSIPTKRYESEPDLPKPKLLLPNAGRSNRHCLSIEKTSKPAKKGQVNNVLPSRRLIAPSLLTTENIARSKYSSEKKAPFARETTQTSERSLKVDVFSCYPCRTQARGRAGRRSSCSFERSLLRRQALSFVHAWRKGLGSLLSYPLLVATLCFNPAEGPQTASRSRSAECRPAELPLWHGTGARSTHTWWATERRLRL